MKKCRRQVPLPVLMKKTLVPPKTEHLGGKGLTQNTRYTLQRRERGDGNRKNDESSGGGGSTSSSNNSGTTMNTRTGVMHNLPVLWLVVGLMSVCHALVSIVGQLDVALLLCVVHAVQCAVCVPGLCSRQQWQPFVGRSESPALL